MFYIFSNHPLCPKGDFFHGAFQVHDKGSPWYVLCLPSTHHSQTSGWLNHCLGRYTLLERKKKTLSPAMSSLVFLNWKLKNGLYLSLAGENRDVFVMLWATVTFLINKILSTIQAARQPGIKASQARGDPVQPWLCSPEDAFVPPT